MTKRYREVLEQVRTGAAGAPTAGPSGAVDDAPVGFDWRGRHYRVLQVLGHWREDAGWWRRPDGQPIRIEQTDLWRVEARNGVPASRGVYELVHRDGQWTLDRVWD
jgi:hypothetical protein